MCAIAAVVGMVENASSLRCTSECMQPVVPGKSNWKGRLSTIDLQVPTILNIIFLLKFLFTFCKMTLLNEEVNCTKSFPVVSIPWWLYRWIVDVCRRLMKISIDVWTTLEVLLVWNEEFEMISKCFYYYEIMKVYIHVPIVYSLLPYIHGRFILCLCYT
jgi:hypothetical protein